MNEKDKKYLCCDKIHNDLISKAKKDLFIEFLKFGLIKSGRSKGYIQLNDIQVRTIIKKHLGGVFDGLRICEEYERIKNEDE